MWYKAFNTQCICVGERKEIINNMKEVVCTCAHALIRVQLCECIYYTSAAVVRSKSMYSLATTTRLTKSWEKRIDGPKRRMKSRIKRGCEWKSRRV